MGFLFYDWAHNIIITQYGLDNRFQPSTNCFWEVSEHVLSRIETPAALAGRSALVDYWSENPWVAKKKGINLFVSSKN